MRQSFVVILKESKRFLHDGPGLKNNQNIKYLEHELYRDVHLDWELSSEGHEMKNVGVCKVNSFVIELVLGNLNIFHCLSNNVLIHNVGGYFLDQVLVTLLDY